MGKALQIRAVSAEERVAIERLAASRTASARTVERGRMLRLSLQGERVPAIARALAVAEDTVRCWLTRFNAAGLDGLADRPRRGRPTTYTPEQVGEVVATALTSPQSLGLPFGCWTLDRLEVYLNEERGLPIKRSRIDDVLLAEGLRWRTQETWFGARAGLERGADQQDAKQTHERAVDPDFAQKRGPSNGSTRPHRQRAS
jgi:transposase